MFGSPPPHSLPEEQTLYASAVQSFKNKQYSETISILDKLIEKNIAHMDARKLRIQAYEESGDPKRGIPDKVFLATGGRSTIMPLATFDQEYKKTFTHITGSEWDPECGRAMHLAYFAQTFLLTDRYTDAISRADEALEINPFDVISLLIRALSYKSLKNSEKVLENLNALVKIASKEEDSYFKRGSFFWEMGDKVRARDDIFQFLKLTIESKLEKSEQQIVLEILMYDLNRSLETEAKMPEVKESSFDSRALVERKPKEAIQFYQRKLSKIALSEQHDHHEDYAFIAYAHICLENYQEAIKYLSISLWLSGSIFGSVTFKKFNTLSYYKLYRKILIEMGDLNGALKKDKIIESFIPSLNYRINQASLGADQHFVIDKKVVRFVEKESKKIIGDITGTGETRQFEFADELVAYARKKMFYGEFDEAEKALRLAVQIQNKSETAHLELGFVLLQRNNLVEAKKEFAKALEISPTNEWIKSNCKLLSIISSNEEAPKKKKKRPKKEPVKTEPRSGVSSDVSIMATLNAKADAAKSGVAFEFKKKEEAPKKSATKNSKRKKKSEGSRRKAEKESEEKRVEKEKEVSVSLKEFEDKLAAEAKQALEASPTSEIKPVEFKSVKLQTTVALTKDEKNCLTRLTDLGCKAYIVGGLVRGKLLGEKFSLRNDMDIVTTATEGQIRKAFPNIYQNPYDASNFSLFIHGVKVDIRSSQKLAVSEIADAQERDFTINSLLLDVNGNVIDPTGRGLSDLLGSKNLELNTIISTEESLTADPIRFIRALKFKLGNPKIFISPDILKHSQQALSQLTSKISEGKLMAWLFKVLSQHPERGFKMMLVWGVIDAIFPAIAAQLKADQTWIIKELQFIAARIEKIHCLNEKIAMHDWSQPNAKLAFGDLICEVNKIRAVTKAHDMFSIFVISAAKQIPRYQEVPNSFWEVIKDNSVLNKFNETTPFAQARLEMLDKTWNAAHRDVNFSPKVFSASKTVSESENISARLAP